ncbi:acetyl-CoA carboxylase biotin carboxyl carrier protein [Psychrobacter sp. PL15]|uniref:acetyl-CoA carboxylase biotin carboxyl carrier protein n=1 Tax=Psychrobacter sp. PL15 TaxID=3071719 RepID=UPI002DFD9988|nr:acetyl-CoA carboxylase biotin carboxyl carrier protein [Psychrobacter sp. PL15]
MDIEQVARVVELVESSQVHEVTIANNGQSIIVVNNLNKQATTSPTGIMPSHKAENSGDEHSQVRAIYVGQVYLSEDDTTDNLVNKGDHIKKGQTVCFIDELTRLLPVISEKEGIVSAILVKNGQNIEYGQPIFNLEV